MEKIMRYFSRKIVTFLILSLFCTFNHQIILAASENKIDIGNKKSLVLELSVSSLFILS
ncbi:MAG: hypothetical protein M0R46_04465 [Candidatus Muirbacterium halophilum]|nr:hypothetical protein [Candidatus Muirbacterium halophilum]MCK9475148.1 hypothetical protein [Candidatus Muirbacterium halophilum]